MNLPHDLFFSKLIMTISTIDSNIAIGLGFSKHIDTKRNNYNNQA